MWRPVGAVLLGYVSVFALVMCGDLVLNQMFPTTYTRGSVPPDNLLMVSTAIFFIASIFGGWLCAKIAPARVGRHILYLFLVGEVLGGIMAASNWNSGFPHWYSFAWLIVWAPALWVGMKLAGPKRHLA